MLYGTHVLVLEPAAGCTRSSFLFLLFKFRIHVRLMECTTRPSDSANTMSSALEVLGLSLPYSSSTPATYDGTCI